MTEQEKKQREQLSIDLRDISNFVGATFNKVKAFNRVYGGEDNPFINLFTTNLQKELTNFQMMINVQHDQNRLAMNQKDPEKPKVEAKKGKKAVSEKPELKEVNAKETKH